MIIKITCRVIQLRITEIDDIWMHHYIKMSLSNKYSIMTIRDSIISCPLCVKRYRFTWEALSICTEKRAIPVMFRFSQLTLYVLTVSVRFPVTADSSTSVSVSQRPSAHAPPASCSSSAGWGAPSTCSGSDAPATSTASVETESQTTECFGQDPVFITLPPCDRRTSPVMISHITTPRSLSGAEPILPQISSQSWLAIILMLMFSFDGLDGEWFGFRFRRSYAQLDPYPKHD